MFGLILGLLGQAVIGLSTVHAQTGYNITGADCVPSSSCTGCNTGIYSYPKGSPSACVGGNECVSTSCTGGTASFSTCIESNTGGPCNLNGTQTAACTGCTDYTSGQCESGGGCSAPPCDPMGTGVTATPIGAWTTWYKCI